MIPDSSPFRVIKQLLPLVSRMHRISASVTILPHEYYYRFETLEALIDSKENILDQYSRFSVFFPLGMGIIFLEAPEFSNGKSFLIIIFHK
jgi:hypothetical protein